MGVRISRQDLITAQPTASSSVGLISFGQYHFLQRDGRR